MADVDDDRQGRPENQDTPRPLDRVLTELRRYRHRLVDFDAREREDGTIDLLMEVRGRPPGVHVYEVPLHSRDIAHNQFPWTFQRILYDCLHDYVVELFLKTPQSEGRGE